MSNRCCLVFECSIITPVDFIIDLLDCDLAWVLSLVLYRIQVLSIQPEPDLMTQIQPSRIRDLFMKLLKLSGYS